MKKTVLLSFVSMMLGVSATTATAADRVVALSAGIFDIGVDEVAEVGAEIRLPPIARDALPKRHSLRPIFGFAVTEEESVYGFAGVRYELSLGEKWSLSPSFGAGLYDEGDGKDLGGPVEFRSGIELAVDVGERSELGLMLYHLSNGVLYDRNPGEESLVLVWSRRFGSKTD